MPNMYSDSPNTPRENPKEDKDSATALIPKSFFPGDKTLEPGNECKVRIERVMDDQVSVTYVAEHEKAEPEEDLEVAEVDEISEMMG